MNKKISFTAIDFAKHPEMIQMDGNNLFALRYECTHAKLYAAYDSIKRSLDHGLNNISYINVHRNKQNDPFYNESIFAHSTSMIINYGRCFASGRAKLERNSVPKEYLDTHDKLMILRNEYIAHSGGAGESTLNLVALYPNTSDKKIIYIENPILVSMQYINEIFLHETQNIVIQLKLFSEEKLRIHYEKICSEIMAMNIDDLYSEFEKFNLKELEYFPSFTPGKYQFKLEVKPDGTIYLKGVNK